MRIAPRVEYMIIMANVDDRNALSASDAAANVSNAQAFIASVPHPPSLRANPSLFSGPQTPPAVLTPQGPDRLALSRGRNPLGRSRPGPPVFTLSERASDGSVPRTASFGQPHTDFRRCVRPPLSASPSWRSERGHSERALFADAALSPPRITTRPPQSQRDDACTWRL